MGGAKLERIFVRKAWYAVGWAEDLAPGQLLPATVMNEVIVLYRDTTGGIVALEDRCCHRAAPLSIGRIEGDALRCMYHGLKFAPDGRCIEIPGQERIPPQTRVRGYAAVEWKGWLWVWMDRPETADPALLPPVDAPDDPAWIFRREHIDYRAHYMLINDNLLDFSHLSYVHEKTFGDTSLFATTRPRIERMPRSLRIARWLRDVPRPATSLSAGAGRTDRWLSYDFHAPGTLILSSATYEAGTADRLGSEAPPGAMPFIEASRSCQVITPLTDGTSRYYFTNGPSVLTGSAAQADHAFRITLAAFDEDKAMIEAQSRTLLIDPYVKMVPVAADAALSQYRWMMKKLMEQEAAAAPAARDGAAA